jgi:predicted peptidase
LVQAGKDFPFIVVSPQCERSQRWHPDAVAQLVDELCGRYKVDRQRMYLTGLSMGGFGTWDTIAAHPKLFAAAAPICGGGDPSRVALHKHIPTWVFHGAKDAVVPLARSEEMVEALKAAGVDVKFTVYPEAGHDSWTETYDNPKLYDWFLRHQRTAP